MAALELPFGLKVLNPQSVDNKYLSGGTTPYTSVANVNAFIPQAIRHIGLTVNILGVEYWYRDGVLDGNLVVKTTSGGVIASGERIEKYIVQANSFVIGDVVGWTGDSAGGYSLAIALNTYNGEVHGLVSQASSTGFTVVYAGYVTGITTAGLTTNKTYFLSDINAGKLTDIAPYTNGSFIKPIYTTQDSSTAGLVLQYLPVAVSTGVTSGGIGSVTGATNLGGGDEVYIGTINSGTTMQFRTISGTGGIETYQIGNVIFISGDSTTVKSIATGTSLTYNATNNDDYIGCSGVTTVNLPSTPTLGKEIIVSDIKGDAFTNNITVLASPNVITGGSPVLINTNYGSITFLWNGIIWSIISWVN
jgi:hypothetical protein